MADPQVKRTERAAIPRHGFVRNQFRSFADKETDDGGIGSERSSTRRVRPFRSCRDWARSSTRAIGAGQVSGVDTNRALASARRLLVIASELKEHMG